MGDHNGWQVALHYGDAEAEIKSCRKSLAVFDLSHFSRVRIAGAESKTLVASLAGEEVASLPVGRQGAAVWTSLQDQAPTKITLQHQEKDYLVVTETPDHEQFLQTLQKQGQSLKVKIKDETFTTAMIALRGPLVLEMLKQKLPVEIDHLEPDDVMTASLFFMRFVIARQDRASHPGVTIILPAKIAPMAWDLFQKYGQEYQIQLAGLQAWQSVPATDQ